MFLLRVGIAVLIWLIVYRHKEGEVRSLSLAAAEPTPPLESATATPHNGGLAGLGVKQHRQAENLTVVAMCVLFDRMHTSLNVISQVQTRSPPTFETSSYSPIRVVLAIL